MSDSARSGRKAGFACGGAVITALGKDTPNVVGLVYLSAFASDQGESMKALVTAEPQPAVGAAIRPDAQGFLWLDRDGFVEYFAPDVNPTQARVLAAVQKPIVASEFMDEEPFGEPAVGEQNYSESCAPFFPPIRACITE